MSSYRPICEECHEDKKPANVAELRGMKFCKSCLTKALERIETQNRAPKDEDE